MFKTLITFIIIIINKVLHAAGRSGCCGPADDAIANGCPSAARLTLASLATDVAAITVQLVLLTFKVPSTNSLFHLKVVLPCEQGINGIDWRSVLQRITVAQARPDEDIHLSVD
jgi:hypothetical protein